MRPRVKKDIYTKYKIVEMYNITFVKKKKEKLLSDSRIWFPSICKETDFTICIDRRKKWFYKKKKKKKHRQCSYRKIVSKPIFSLTKSHSAMIEKYNDRQIAAQFNKISVIMHNSSTVNDWVVINREFQITVRWPCVRIRTREMNEISKILSSLW